MSKTNSRGHFTAEEARFVIWTRAAETSLEASGELPAAAASRVTQTTRKMLGEKPEDAAFLTRRASELWHEMRCIRPDLPKEPETHRIFPAAAAVALTAFALGAAADYLSGDASRLNLLAPPFLLYFLWNIAVYTAVILSLFIRHPVGPARLQESAVRFFKKRMLRSGKDSDIGTRFAALWAKAAAPLYKNTVSAVFHACAAAFAFGMICSVLVRGFGTAYSAGWESTWLWNMPAAVGGILHFLYGLIPCPFADPVSSLSAEDIESMRFGAGTAVSAGPWLIRLLWSTAAIVLIPRLLLTAAAVFRIRSVSKNFPLELDDPYYEELLTAAHGDTVRWNITEADRALSDTERASLEAFISRNGRLCAEFSYVLAQTGSEPPDIPHGHSAAAVFPMTSTPEDEVHGTFVRELSRRAKEANVPLRVIVNTGAFRRRFSGTPHRTEERTRLWREFLSRNGISPEFADLEKPEHPDEKS